MTNPEKRVLLAVALSIASIAVHGLSATAHAQEGGQEKTEEQLLACDRIADTTEKMACFDAVIQELKQDSAVPDAESESVQVASSAGDTAERTTAATAGAATAADLDVAPEGAPESAQSAAESVAPAAATPVVTNAAKSAGSAEAINEFGLEDKMAAEEKEQAKLQAEQNPDSEVDTIYASIVEVWPTIDNRFEVRLDNDQVWRETELTRTYRLAKVGTKIRITKGSLGSFHMKFGNNNRLAGVRRTK